NKGTRRRRAVHGKDVFRRISLLPWSLVLGHITGEPVGGAFQHVAEVCGVDKTVTLVGVDDQLRGNVEIAQGMPELEGLGGGTFAVAIADDQKGGRMGLLNEGDGGALV